MAIGRKILAQVQPGLLAYEYPENIFTADQGRDMIHLENPDRRAIRIFLMVVKSRV